jgi:hypothetical protein
MRLDELDLSQLLIGAAESPPSSRIEFRDPIARHGEAAVLQIEPWLGDKTLAAFAIRVIRRSAEFGARDQAIRVLRSAMDRLAEPHKTDALKALDELGSRISRTARPPRPQSTPVVTSSELVEGRVYRRKDLHEAGLGGNRQKGISYGANATEVFLFSDPGTREEWGYRDSWQGRDAYVYYGEWSGAGDMSFVGGNKAMLDRSPEIHLFTRVANGHQYAGRFAVERSDTIPASRDGRQWNAIVFRLRRA